MISAAPWANLRWAFISKWVQMQTSIFKRKWEVSKMVSARGLNEEEETGSRTEGKKRDFACTFDGCSNAYTRKIHLQRHLASHSGKKDFVCLEDNCGKAFSNNDILKKHIRRIHRERIFKCNYEGCDKTFKKHQHLTVHSYVHTNIKPFKCQHEGCEARFKVPSKLKSHAKIHKGYTCDKEGCGLHFDKWSGLRKHLSYDHITEYKCEQCGKVYHKKHKLRVHVKSHEQFKEVLTCPRENCNRSYLKASYLELHVKNYHDGGRPYACDHPGCSKTFVHKGSLCKHQVVHKPDYVRPPPKPRKKRGLASQLSCFPDEASRPRLLKMEMGAPEEGSHVTKDSSRVDVTQWMDTAEEPAVTEDRVSSASPEVELEMVGDDGTGAREEGKEDAEHQIEEEG